MLKSPLAFSAALYAFQFVVRYLHRPQLVSLITRAYSSCELDLCNNAQFNGVPRKTFYLHLKETEFRFNHRNQSLYKALLSLLRANPL